MMMIMWIQMMKGPTSWELWQSVYDDANGKDGVGGGGDNNIMMKCLCVCVSRKIITSGTDIKKHN